MNKHMAKDPALEAKKPEIYWNMLQTAENVAKRYKIPREVQDQYGVQSQQRAAAAQAAGRYDAEISPIEVVAGVADRDSGRLATKTVKVSADEGIRGDTTY
ncbi:MAG: acetyl-CoA C-acyltransferase, partial [Burkholderiales bacterium]|nr:acetyl-CoA C-acyltransferase [Burkholderiales bacterium]